MGSGLDSSESSPSSYLDDVDFEGVDLLLDFNGDFSVDFVGVADDESLDFEGVDVPLSSLLSAATPNFSSLLDFLAELPVLRDNPTSRGNEMDGFASVVIIAVVAFISW